MKIGPKIPLLKQFFKRTFSRRGRQESQRGMALIFVLSLVGVIMAVMGEVFFQAQITVRSSNGEQDRMRAEAAALTGAQFALFLIALEAQVNDVGENKNLPPALSSQLAAIPAMVKSQLGGKNLSELLNGFPIGSQGLESIKDLSKINLSASLDEGLLEALQNIQGYFVLDVSNESAKLNLNLFTYQPSSDVAFEALLRIFSMPREARWLEEKGYSPKRLAANVKDYIDRDKIDSADTGDEVGQYGDGPGRVPGRPKNAALESLEELRKIPGFNDDEIFRVFSPYFTIWPLSPKDSKLLDFNVAKVELISALVTPPGKDIEDTIVDRIEDKRAEGAVVSKPQELDDLISSPERMTREIRSRLFFWKSQIYRVNVRGISGNVERTYQMILEKNAAAVDNLRKDKKPSAPAASPAAAATPADPSAAPPTDPSGAPSAPIMDSQKSPLRIVYQRFL
ncbi:MAG: general secretion pathway protein GspK [Betaproteobacteria bacterium]|nr:general secretion pathway protein GspK [Betaproteobacteria bacterium]